MFKKLLAILLVCTMVLVAFVACGGKDTGEDPVQQPSNNKKPDAEASYDITEILPESLKYQNTEFIVSVRNATRTIKDLGVNKDDTTPLAKELCERTFSTEERLGVSISIDYLLSTNVNDTISNLRNKIQYQEHVWDAVAGVSYRIPELASEGLFYNLYNFDYLDMSQEWWSQPLVKELTVNDRLFLATGDISMEYMDMCHAVFFNQTLAKSMGMDYSTFYTMVSNGKWTFDQLYRLSKDAYNKDSGQYGLLIQSTMLQAFYGAARINVVVNNGNDRPFFEFNTDHIESVWSELSKLLQSPSTVIHSSGVNSGGAQILGKAADQYFADGKALFLCATLDSLVDFTNADMQDSYGVLPTPKYNEAQTEYGTQLHSCALWCIPIDAKDPDMSAAVMTSMAYDSHEIVIEPHFERLLKTRYVKDSESGYMIDTIYYNMYMNFDSIYNEVFDPGADFSNKDVMPMFIFGALVNGTAGSANAWWDQNEESLKGELEFVLSSFYQE